VGGGVETSSRAVCKLNHNPRTKTSNPKPKTQNPKPQTPTPNTAASVRWTHVGGIPCPETKKVELPPMCVSYIVMMMRDVHDDDST